MDMNKLNKAAHMLRVVAHPVRMGMIEALKEVKQLSVSEIQSIVETSQSMTSQHLAALRHIGVVASRKEANICYYYLQNRKVLKLLDCVQRCCEQDD